MSVLRGFIVCAIPLDNPGYKTKKEDRLKALVQAGSINADLIADLSIQVLTAVWNLVDSRFAEYPKPAI